MFGPVAGRAPDRKEGKTNRSVLLRSGPFHPATGEAPHSKRKKKKIRPVPSRLVPSRSRPAAGGGGERESEARQYTSSAGVSTALALALVSINATRYDINSVDQWHSHRQSTLF